MLITRFAPSPTGDPHIGSVRTALFAYLAAKSSGGKFLLRIEDTDRKRYVESSVTAIKEALDWLGTKPDSADHLIIQSKRLEIYRQAAIELIKKDQAYLCDCTEERLRDLRERQRAAGQPPKYDGRCRQKPKAGGLEAIPEGTVVRAKNPQSGQITLDDLVRGKVRFDLSTLDDEILLKSDGFPTYHLASVVDDHEMKITHVIRAEEWLPSTPKHLLLYRMFGWKPPRFAHLPVILSSKRGKLSKRDGAVGVLEYKKMGYLPEALVNFMALLGWSSKTDEELFTLAELANKFRIEQVNKSPAVFDLEKLNYFNRHYLKSKNAGEIAALLADFGLENPNCAELELARRGGWSTLGEISEYLNRLRQPPRLKGDLIIFKKSDKEKTTQGLELATKHLSQIPDKKWGQGSVQLALQEAAKQGGLQNGDVFWPVRYALSGEEKSPSPAELAGALGKDEAIRRIQAACKIQL